MTLIAAPGPAPQIAGLKILGILVVCLHHWLPGPLTKGILRGAYGAELLFVLAGFLGMRLVLRHTDPTCKRGSVRLGSIYARGLLRGCPLFVLLGIAVALLTGHPWATKIATLTFSYNFLAIEQGHLTGTLAHLWAPSISVQFFLFSTLVLSLLPRNAWAATLLAMVLAGPLSRGVLLLSEASPTTLRCASIASWDALAGGALVALLVHDRGIDWLWSRPWMRVLPWAGLALLGAGMALLYRDGQGSPRSVAQLFLITFKSPFMIWCVAGAARGFPGTVGKVLASGPMQRLSALWIGLYLFHALAPLGQRLSPVRGLPWPVLMLVYATFTLLAAGVAFRLVERPLLRWTEPEASAPQGISPGSEPRRRAA